MCGVVWCGVSPKHGHTIIVVVSGVNISTHGCVCEAVVMSLSSDKRTHWCTVDGGDLLTPWFYGDIVYYNDPKQVRPSVSEVDSSSVEGATCPPAEHLNGTDLDYTCSEVITVNTCNGLMYYTCILLSCNEYNWYIGIFK